MVLRVLWILSFAFGLILSTLSGTSLLNAAPPAFDGQPVGATGQDRMSAEQLLPHSTCAFVSVPDLDQLVEHFRKTELGQLAKNEDLKPFIESIEKQVQDWLNEKNVRLGARIENIKGLETGEICLAGVLRRPAGAENLGRGSHGLLMMVDVLGKDETAQKLLNQISSEFESRGATRGSKEINGVPVTSWTVEREGRRVASRTTWYASAGGRFLAADNETIFREVLQRLANPDSIKIEETLASLDSFNTVMGSTRTESIHTDLRWFINPFGYLELAQEIEAEEQEFRQRRRQWIQDFRNEGFDALGGVGGQVAFGTGDHEVLHRTFIYAPRLKLLGEKHQRVFGLIDFENRDGRNLDPPSWISEDVSFFLTGVWDVSKAWNNIGPFVDIYAGENAWSEVLDGYESQMGLDMPGVIGQFNNQIIIASQTQKPVGESSERIGIFVPLRGDNGELLNDITKIVGEESVEAKKLVGKPVIEIDNSVEEIQEIPRIGSSPPPDLDGNQAEEFKLFEKSFVGIENSFMNVCNDKEMMKEILSGRTGAPLAESRDYKRVSEALDKLTTSELVSFRQFGRIDRMLETHYELLRQNKMGSSGTVLSRVLNQLMVENGQPPSREREQKLDGSTLPADYEKAVGHAFGPSSWVMETQEDGWRITGLMLKKKEQSEMVQNGDDSIKNR